MKIKLSIILFYFSYTLLSDELNCSDCLGEIKKLRSETNEILSMLYKNDEDLIKWNEEQDKEIKQLKDTNKISLQRDSKINETYVLMGKIFNMEKKV